MDALALLCTLHADGPTTLRALRSAGCHSLVDLGQCNSNELAQFLELSVASAERLQREAELLSSRLAPLQPEHEVAPESELELTREEQRQDEPVAPPEAQETESEEPHVLRPLPPALAASRANRSWFSATRIPLVTAQARVEYTPPSSAQVPEIRVEPVEDLPSSSQPVAEQHKVEAVEPPLALELEEARRTIEELAARPVLAEEPETPAATIVVEPSPKLVAIAPESTFADESTERLQQAATERAALPTPEPPLETPAPSAEEGVTPLQVGQPDGLERELLVALEAAGVRTAEALVQASGLELSRELGVPFTRLLELQLGAQHLFRRSSTLVPQRRKRRPAIEPVSEPAREPRTEPTAPGSQNRRHTDSPRIQPLRSPANSDLSDSFTPPSDGSVGGPFA